MEAVSLPSRARMRFFRCDSDAIIRTPNRIAGPRMGGFSSSGRRRIRRDFHDAVSLRNV